MERTRGNNFGTIRLVAALFVLQGHMRALLGQSSILFYHDGIHAIGVEIFFLIGGYLVTKSWYSDPHPIRYATKRILRIWPPLIVCVLLCAFVLGPLCTKLTLQEYFAAPELWNYLRNIRLYICYTLPGVFLDNPYPGAVNGSLWTLPIEVFMYLVIGVWFWAVGKCGGRKNPHIQQAGSLILMAIGLIFSFVFSGIKGQVVYGTPVDQMAILVPYYILGSVYAIFVPQKVLNLPAAVCLFLATNGFLGVSVFHSWIRMLVLSYLIFSLAFATPVLQLPKWMEISYGIYLFGFPIQQLVVEFAVQRGWQLERPNRMLVICILLIIPMAFLSKFFVEGPADRLCKKICAVLPRREKIQKSSGEGSA